MKILFVVGAYPYQNEGLVQKHCKNVSPSSAANVFQWAIIDGLQKNHADFEVISYPFLPCFPKNYSRLYSPKSLLEYKGKIVGSIDSYCTLPFIKNFSIKRKLRYKAEEWLKHKYSQSDDIVVLTYSPVAFFIEPIAKLKKKFPRLRICSIVTDLPDFFTSPLNNLKGIKRIQARFEQKAIFKNYRYIDQFVLLTEQMEDKIPNSKNNSIVIEGISSVNELPVIDKKDSEKRIVLYTGALRDGMGIRDLVDAFMMTKDSSFELDICGSGECSDYIEDMAKKDSRIHYLGRVSRDRSVELQRKATLLVNPRKPQDFTKYSFPSKTMEYMTSGTPMMGYKLQGIPKEYYDYYYTINALDINALSERINEVLSLRQEELNRKAIEAGTFIIKNKTSFMQVKKILDFLNQRKHE